MYKHINVWAYITKYVYIHIEMYLYIHMQVTYIDLDLFDAYV